MDEPSAVSATLCPWKFALGPAQIQCGRVWVAITPKRLGHSGPLWRPSSAGALPAFVWSDLSPWPSPPTHSVQAQHCSLMSQGCSRDTMLILDGSPRWFSAQSSLKIILSLFSMSTVCFIFLCRTFPHLLIMYLFIVLPPQEHEHYKTRDFDCSIWLVAASLTYTFSMKLVVF